MAAAAGNDATTVKSSFYHPEHMLTAYHYGSASTYPCAACERVVTGVVGYRCDECDFNIHKSCFEGLPGSVSLGQINGHELTCALTRLGATQPCGICEETSHAGRYMYLCAQVELYVHPRCVTQLLQQPNRRGRGRTTGRAVLTGLRVVDQVAHTAHSVTTLVDVITTVASCTIM